MRGNHSNHLINKKIISALIAFESYQGTRLPLLLGKLLVNKHIGKCSFLCQSAHITLLSMVINDACSYYRTPHALICQTHG